MGSATAKAVPCGSTCVRGNAVTSLLLMCCSRTVPAATVMGDQGDDRDKIRKMLSQQGITPCILPRRCRKKPVHDSKRVDRKRHKIENLFSRLKDWRRLATREDRGAQVFRSAILLAAIVLFW